jgi:hypothetical protein
MSEQGGFSIKVRAGLLQKHEAEAEIVLRLGAIANALLTVGRSLPESNETALERKDTFQLLITAASHIYVAIKELEKRHDGLMWRLATRGVHLRDLPVPLDRLRALLTRDSPFARVCGRIRNAYAFHVDREPFQAYIRKQEPTGRITLFALQGANVEHVLFPASYEALVSAIPEVLPPDTVFDTVAEVVHSFPYLVEAIIIGFHEVLQAEGQISKGS